MVKVESFELDHTKVKAPYVRKAGIKIGPKGDIVSKFDLRFVQPNIELLYKYYLFIFLLILLNNLKFYFL